MKVHELISMLLKVDQELAVIVRGENIITEISEIYVDTDHTDDSEFLSIDLEPESLPDAPEPADRKDNGHSKGCSSLGGGPICNCGRGSQRMS